MGKYRPLVVCTIQVGSSQHIAVNDGKTSPRFRVKHEDGNVSHSGHAEMRVLSKLPKGFNPLAVKVHVVRYTANGEKAMAKPCVHCQAHLWRVGIPARNVWFTNEKGEYERFSQATA